MKMQPNASRIHSIVIISNENATQCFQSTFKCNDDQQKCNPMHANASVKITNENAINDSQTNLNILDKLCWSNTSQSFSIYTFFQFALVIIVLVTMLNEGKKSFFHIPLSLMFMLWDIGCWWWGEKDYWSFQGLLPNNHCIIIIIIIAIIFLIIITFLSS